MEQEERKVFSYDPTSRGGFKPLGEDDIPVLTKDPEPPTEEVIEKPSDEEKVDVETQVSETEEPEVDDPEVEEPEADEVVGDDTEDEGEGEPEIDDEEEVVTDDFYRAASETMKARGELPEDFELDENLT